MTAIVIPSRCEPGLWANQNPGPSPGLERDLLHSLGNSCMVDEPQAPGTKQRGPESRSGPAPTYSAHSALIQSLQSLRERVLERLLSLETLAQSQSASAQGAAASADLERTLELKLAELAETERRLDDQAARQEKEWSASLIKLESDRRLLAEAWERIERERIACSSPSETHHHGRAQGQGSQKGALTDLPHAGALVTARSAAADSDTNHPVTQAILRQFQTLSSDVRRNAASRRDSR
jgi:hypothetical protein